MRTLHKMSGRSMLASICIIGVLIAALLPVPAVTGDSSESGFHISQLTGGTWEEIYQHQFQVEYSTDAIAVDVLDGRVLLRIVQAGTPFADIDQISLMIDGVELSPEYARYTASGQTVLQDILELDDNVVIAHEQEVEIYWDVPAGYDSATVYVTANEYDDSNGMPFRFPEMGYATYEMGSDAGSITVDGLISEIDGTVPLYSPFWRPVSGHPDGYTYIYVCDDEQYVYFSLDIASDNTNEYGEDWAELRILKPDGSEQAFRVDDFDNTWGESGFGLTSKVSYRHQTCEFAIPKSIIGNDDIEFGLVYYGTEIGPAYDFDPAVDLAITINGSSASGQVFQVGDTLDIDGYVTSYAWIQGYGYLEAWVDWELYVSGPSGYRSDWGNDDEDNDLTGATYVMAEANNETVSLEYDLTAPGTHTIWLDSDAYVYGDDPYVNTGDDYSIQLSFTVVEAPSKTADLITDGGDNPTDLGDLNVSYESGNFTVEYILDAPWEIVDTQVYIGTTPPAKSSPGKFPYEAGEITFNPGSSESVYIAAHAKIRMQTGVNSHGHPVYAYAGVWAQTGDDTRIGKGANWATYFQYVIPDQNRSCVFVTQGGQEGASWEALFVYSHSRPAKSCPQV